MCYGHRHGAVVRAGDTSTTAVYSSRQVASLLGRHNLPVPLSDAVLSVTGVSPLGGPKHTSTTGDGDRVEAPSCAPAAAV